MICGHIYRRVNRPKSYMQRLYSLRSCFLCVSPHFPDPEKHYMAHAYLTLPHFLQILAPTEPLRFCLPVKMKMTFSPLLLLLLLVFSFSTFAFGATLPEDEVQVLKDIAGTLGKNDWNFSIDPCSGEGNWRTPNAAEERKNDVICDCSFANGNLCHVTNILLKSQNLLGTLPVELVRLPFLQEIDLTFNYLNGTIPKQWGSMNLVNISLYGNRLTGPIPKELGNITTLKSLVLEYNQFTGNLPPELGNLSQIQRLHLTSNYFTGNLPITLAKLTTLQELRIGDNQFSGKIPDFIQSWTSLRILAIHGTNLSGPIPSGISLLKAMEDLRMSDLNGSEYSPFPQLQNMTNLNTLIMRSCNINGTLPDYLGNLTSLKTIDLSFNKLSGPIPSTFVGRRNFKYIYLTRNLLTGTVPAWTGNTVVDLSYNNFSNGGQETCQQGNVNLFASSSPGNNLGTISCLRSSPCPKNTFFYINCGGKSEIVKGNKTYDDDSSAAGPAEFHQGGINWAYSTTGYFLDNGTSESADNYTRSITSKLSMTNAALYMNARVSPISLTYYGFCLENGNYMVNLHFAEIMFTDDETYSSLGRRVFDVYIQGERVLKDFNIAEQAGGVFKPVIKLFPAVVTSNTLEIRLYWAGKGTTAIPFKSVYGPLISAISADLVSTPNGSSISTGAVVGIVAAAIIIILLFGILWWRGCIRRKSSLANDLTGLELQTGLFTLRQIKSATNNFDVANKIGEGGFGPVYKGILSNGTIIAVKLLSSKSRQGNREFINEIGLISALQHPSLVKLYGCCVEEDQLLLVYEYMENNSLARALFGREEYQLKLDWPTRHKICVGIARGLAYLHEESRFKIVHRDIKATNVLLDKDLNPKISDFGLAKLNEEENTHISTRIAGTYGYMAPEYAMHGYLTNKADVYSFGVVALEVVSGKSNTIRRPNEEVFHLLDWAQLLKEKGNLMELVDGRLRSNINKEQAMVMIKVGLLCTNASPTLRPTMSSVVSMLEGKTVVQEVVSESSEVLDEKRLEAMRHYYQQTQENNISETRTESTSRDDGPCTASSKSEADLYPPFLDSSDLEKRV